MRTQVEKWRASGVCLQDEPRPPFLVLVLLPRSPERPRWEIVTDNTTGQLHRTELDFHMPRLETVGYPIPNILSTGPCLPYIHLSMHGNVRVKPVTKLVIQP